MESLLSIHDRFSALSWGNGTRRFHDANLTLEWPRRIIIIGLYLLFVDVVVDDIIKCKVVFGWKKNIGANTISIKNSGLLRM
jgi:hypothetical protein